MPARPVEPLTSLVRRILERAARVFKGDGYRLSPDLPLSALLGLAARRAAALARGMLRGAGRSRRPGDAAFLGPGVSLRNRGSIRFGRGVTLDQGALVDGLSREGVELGDRVHIGPYCIIEATGILSDLGKGVRIGADSGLGAFSFIGAAGGVEIGEKVIMGQRVSLHAENHIFARLDLPIKEQGVTRQGIRIGDDCWVGANVTFLDGARVGRGCVIAAGAVVRGEIPDFSVAGGVPARVLRSRTEGPDGDLPAD